MTDDVSILALSLDTWLKVARGLWGVDMWHFVTRVTLYGFPKNIPKIEIKLNLTSLKSEINHCLLCIMLVSMNREEIIQRSERTGYQNCN